jgi:hypothetical protein
MPVRSSPSPIRAAFWRLTRDGTWINADRFAAGAPILLLCLIAAAAYLLIISPAAAGDYRSFWTASILVLRERAADVYNPAIHYATQNPNGTGGWEAFFYPPVFLLFCAPMALLPFGVSATGFLLATAAFFYAAIRHLIPNVPGATCAALSLPAAWLNAGAGQNGFLTAGLLTLGVVWLDRRPFLSGIAFGCLCYKPQFAFLIPVALVASARWPVLAAAAATAAALTAASVAAFGVATWAAFLDEHAVGQGAIEHVREGPGKMISVMGTLLSLDAPAWMAYGAQLATSLAACVIIGLIARRHREPVALGAALCACATLGTPWLHRYDLVVLALPIAWMVSQGLRSGFRPWEKLGLLLLFWLPFVSGPIGLRLDVSIEAAAITALIVMIWRRLHAAPADIPG